MKKFKITIKNQKTKAILSEYEESYENKRMATIMTKAKYRFHRPVVSVVIEPSLAAENQIDLEDMIKDVEQEQRYNNGHDE